MFSGRVTTLLRLSSIAGFACVMVAEAQAGGFALREQSAYEQGASFAGAAAGGDPSALFWNPAIMTQFDGVWTSISASAIVANSKNTPTPCATCALFPFGGTDNIAGPAVVPSGYFTYQINPALWFGLSINSPYGLDVNFPSLWAGRVYAAGDSHLHTYNVTPSVAYRINNWISIGAGLQIQYADAALSRGPVLPGPTFAKATLKGDGWGVGFTAGATLTPTPWTTIGIGYRSFIDQKIQGNLTAPVLVPPFPSATIGADTTVDLPDMVSLGIRQRLDPQWTLLGTVEWTNWSRTGTSTVKSGGATVTTIPFQYDDGWFFSAGVEYQWDPRLTLRTGVAYEISPITDDVRIPLLPDNDRFWVSIGATYKIARTLAIDLAYSHIWVKDAPINITPGSPNPWFPLSGGVGYTGNVESHIDIISVALKYRWDEPAPVRTSLVTK